MAAKGNTKIIYAALIANCAIAVTKFAASAFTGSSAMFAEAVHSVVDTGNQGLLLFGLRQAKRPPSEDHPFGHGKDLYFYAFCVAIVIFGAGAGFSAYEGIEKLRHPGEISSPYVNYIVLALAFAFESYAWLMAFRAFQAARGDMGFFEAVHRSKDPTLFTVLFEDSAAMLGLIIAFLGVLVTSITGNPLFDALATLGIAAVLAATAVLLAIETKGLLVGEGADPMLVSALRTEILAEPGVKRVNELLTMHFGPNEILLTASVDFDDSLGADDVEAAVARLNTAIRTAYPDVKRLFIEAQDRASHRQNALGADIGA